MELVGDDGVLDEEFEGNDVEGRLVGGFEDDGTCGAGLLDLQPARGADAPTVPRLEAGEAILRHGGGEVVAEGLRRGEKRLVDDAANGMHAKVFGAGLAASGAVESGHGGAATGGEGLAEDVLAAGFGFGGQRSGYKLKAIGSHGYGEDIRTNRLQMLFMLLESLLMQ